MSDPHYPPEQPPEATAPAGPFWKNKWVIGGAVAVALLVGYQMTRRGPEIQTRPVGPQDAPAGQPGQQGPGGAPGQVPLGQAPGQAPNQVPMAQGPTVGQVPGQPGQAPAGQPAQVPTGEMGSYTLLGAPNGQLPLVNVSYTPVIGYSIQFSFNAPNGPVIADFMLPDVFNAGFASVTMQQAGQGNTQYVYSGGMAELGFRRYDGQPARTFTPQWSIDNIGVGGTCIAIIDGNRSHAEVEVGGATMCVMDRSCNQAYACGKLRQ